MIPRDDFTPHAYLDNPYHSWKINPSGVLRSLAPLGMGWHVPNLGSYGRNQFQYTAHLTIGLKIEQAILLTPADFKRHGCNIVSHVHTKNRFEYTCSLPEHNLRLSARYFLVGENALGCVIALACTAQQPLRVTCYLVHRHTHNPHTSRLWEHGLYACSGPEAGTALLGIASEGDAFVHGARAADGPELNFAEMGYVVSLADAAAWIKGGAPARPTITQSQPDTGWQVRSVILPCELVLGGASAISERIINVVLARGVSQDQAYQHWADGIEEIARAEAEHQADDEAFWRRAPQLSGDWPACWRRGLVYDLETLRMVIRSPLGSIEHFFDGMQVQAPRLVLAEAALDVLLLSYADPDLAAEVILGHFATAPHPNLPCMREDGSYNMIADDGQICGTAPEWAFPIWCCDQIFRRTGDLHWLRRLYPGVATYLRWWLEHRRDAQGWLVYACSWESGQDVSSRFGPQQTGGTIIQHVRPVDLQASMAQAGAILARWATLLMEEGSDASMPNFAAEISWWHTIAGEFSARTRQMWQRGWFRDYDAVSGEWSEQRDTMHLAPVFCGVAGRDQIERLRPYLAQPPMHSSGWAPLSWPPVVMTLVGAAAAADMSRDAAELAYSYIDAAYRASDSSELDEQGGLPGVAREYHSAVARGKWGKFDYVNGGIEGYGWGALSIHLLLRYLLGMQEEEGRRISVRPVLAQTLRRPGATYRVETVSWGEYALSMECEVKDTQRYQLSLRCLAASPDDAQPAAQEYSSTWEGIWGEGRTLQLPQLTPSFI